jgi:hypothetical protein
MYGEHRERYELTSCIELFAPVFSCPQNFTLHYHSRRVR